jgi:hypothetical protein
MHFFIPSWFCFGHRKLVFVWVTLLILWFTSVSEGIHHFVYYENFPRFRLLWTPTDKQLF